MSDPVLAWHFLTSDRRLANGDCRVVYPGSRLTVDGPVVLCDHGLHASVRAIDALQYASGPIICRVLVAGSVVLGDDKIAGTSRRCLWTLDDTRMLREFACWCARQALALIPDPDPRSVAAIDVSERFARGEATSEELSAARDAAWDAQNTELERRIRAAHRAQCGGEL